MKKIIYLLLIISIFSIDLFAQAPIIEWQKCYGGSDFEDADVIQKTEDGGYIISGLTSSKDGDVIGKNINNNLPDGWIVKLDSKGNIQWQKCIGGSGDDYTSSIEQTTDGGFIIAGGTDSKDDGIDGKKEYLLVVKISSEGIIQWQKRYGGSENDFASAIRQTTDGGYIVLGSSRSNDSDVKVNRGLEDYWILKLNSTGEIQWQKCIGDSNYMLLSRNIIPAVNGGYILLGNIWAKSGIVNDFHGLADIWVAKLSPSTYINDFENVNFANTEEISISPMPSSDFVTIKTLNIEDKEYIVYDIFGRKIVSSSLSNNEIKLDISGYTPGIYSIVIESERKMFVVSR